MNLEIRHLKLVEAVAETGSVTRAGHRLHLTQSALSHQLRDAEEQLGVALFERKNGRMSLTSAGGRLLETARTVLAELERAESEIQRSSGPARGLLRISTQCHTVYHWFPPRLLIFQKKFPTWKCNWFLRHRAILLKRFLRASSIWPSSAILFAIVRFAIPLSSRTMS